VQKASASQKRINDFLNREEVDLQSNDEELSLSKQIEFKQVSHRYSDKNENALSDISFKLSKGEIIGFTGKTGPGKSTLLQLLTKQIQVQSGQILIDNQSISNLHLNAYRKMIAYVPQDVFLFSVTIEANIAFGVSEYSQEHLNQIIRITCLDKDIALFEHGKNTILGERGVSLSGGQKQRVSLARALMKNSDILILDDCLSAVDAETESRIIYNLKEVFNNKTVIITSHRVAPLQHADVIFILEKGKIIESGNHEFLISFGGYYQWLYENQTS
jgi:ATP-binding cassette subfamily B protein